MAWRKARPKLSPELTERYEALRAEDPLRAGVPAASAEDVAALSGPFGNSTKQNRVSGLVTTDRMQRPDDRLP